MESNKNIGRYELIILKSEKEIEIMREAGRIVAECHGLIKKMIKPGVTTLEIDEMVEKYIREKGAIPSFKGYHGFPFSTCAAPNDVICHGMPNNVPLKEGDVITIDIGALYNGFHGDSAWSYAVGEVRQEIKDLMETTLEALHKGIEQAVEGNCIGDIGNAIEKYVRPKGYGIVVGFAGHGVGSTLWEEPEILHVGEAKTGPKLKNGMTIAIEPMITLGHWKAKIDSDGWTARTIDGSVCVQYEHSIAITPEGPKILTTL
ncbi:type I methionyl aminopeptidase [Ilyobacter polytropus]|uniref:Methionine aminopeptidase n=1 Tax=Ilyobacter polytropus (strain ATCC 51220 / DSM 2926 / LMG 16218 / CuHBu1) TaxID=572544 RepID=E3H7N8_ILYPC|nr:type I methionyl aminopeptidase [Ilyobacter polytropus]ADO82620.1 methionine aminopeptidase, type I [Ilyobacter polytropus DSM 2926]